MAKDRASPQEKKQLQLARDHFTFSESPHGFRKTWKQKKAETNRQYRRKSEELLSQLKPEISPEDVELITDDVTISHLKNGITRKRLKKSGTVSVGEKVKIKLEKRAETVGRRVNHQRKYDAIVASAVRTLNSLEGEQLVDVVKRIILLLRGGDPVEWMRLYESGDSLDRAVFFVERLNRGDGFYWDALRRNRELCESFQLWRKNANQILAKVGRPQERDLEQRIATEKKVKVLRRQASKS